MNDKPAKPNAPPADSREARLAAALRGNLRKRKAAGAGPAPAPPPAKD